MMTIIKKAKQIHRLRTDEERIITVSFKDELPSGVTLQTVIKVEEISTTELTLMNKVVNGIAVDIEGIISAPGQAIQCKVTSNTVGTYNIDFIGLTNGSVPETIAGTVELRVVDR